MVNQMNLNSVKKKIKNQMNLKFHNELYMRKRKL